jgi:hypothetical protein
MKEDEFKGGRMLMNDEPVGEMTLRDYFAGRAISSILSAEWWGKDISFTFDNTAEVAYKLADAMLRERLKFK